MATYVKQSSGLGVFGWIFLFLIFIALIAAGYYGYQQWKHGPEHPVTQEDIAGLEERLDTIEKRQDVIEGNQTLTEWWTIIKWLLIIFGIIGIALYWIHQHYTSQDKHITIEEGLELGSKWLEERRGFTTVWSDGSSMQRREGSPDRVLLLMFSRVQYFQGVESMPHMMMYIACLNDSWDHRFVSKPGMTFKQFMDYLHDLEVIGFSVQKEPELAGLLALGEKGRAMNAQGELMKDIGLTPEAPQ